MTADNKVLADRDATKCYVFDGVTYVPHYINDQFFSFAEGDIIW